jgi:hypothetical protein
MELGRSAPMLMSASPGRGGGDGAGAGPSGVVVRDADRGLRKNCAPGCILQRASRLDRRWCSPGTPLSLTTTTERAFASLGIVESDQAISLVALQHAVGFVK